MVENPLRGREGLAGSWDDEQLEGGQGGEDPGGSCYSIGCL